ncbi:DUF3846 domain-containing protein [uncultured Flavonifractor sp.]|uniref:DUF3846 domain-containing protein n=1 Tax=uncultured Flavonifractor sp. TaxID=1193534 RepID=UPI0025D08E82|nr:DUF3846 domain-containing protein [uncultured Flavonifractor sp.]
MRDRKEVIVMLVLIIKPGKEPCRMELGHSLAEMQKAVGGSIQILYPFDEPVALVCNEEGKLLNLPVNRALRDEEGRIYDIVSGTFFLCGAPADSDALASLTEEQICRYEQRFARPELFLNIGGRIICLPDQ